MATFSIGPASRTVDEDAGSVTFTITRSSTAVAETVFVSTVQGKTKNVGDYGGWDTIPLAFPVGVASRPVTISIVDDNKPEDDESFRLIVQRNANDPVATFLDDASFTIRDDDAAVAAASYAIAPGARSVDEDEGSVTFTVTRTGGAGSETVYVSTVQHGTVNQGDYQGWKNVPVTFAGAGSQTVTIPIFDDSSDEPDETFGIIVQRNPNDPLDTFLDDASFTIHDDDAAVAAASYAIAPGARSVDEDEGSVTFTVTRTGGAGSETVYVSTVQHGTVNQGDYQGWKNVPVTFAGAGSQTVTIPIFDDSSDEPDETFGIIVQRNPNDPLATFLDDASFTIHDDDAAVAAASYAIAPGARSVDEDEGSVAFTVTRTGGAGSETVYVSTVQHGTVNQGDYQGWKNVPVTFAGAGSQTVTIPIFDDSSDEPDETFGIIVQRNPNDPLDTFLDDASFTIHDDDAAVAAASYAIAPGARSVDEDEGSVAFTVTRTGGAGSETVYVSTVQHGTVNQGDYQGWKNVPVTFAGAGSQTVTIPIFDDNSDEPDETFGIIVQRNPNDPLDTLDDASFTIRDDDAAVSAPPTEVDPPASTPPVGTATTDYVPEGPHTNEALLGGWTVYGTIDQFGMDGVSPYVDKDYYLVGLSGGHRYTFQGDAQFSYDDTLDSLFIRLRDGSGAKLASDPYAEGPAPAFDFVAPGSEFSVYLLAVSAGGAGAPDDTGDFSIRLIDHGFVTDAPPDPVAPEPIVHPPFSPMPVPPPEPQAGDQVREGSDTEHELAVGGTVWGTIDQFGIDGQSTNIDKDYYRVILEGGARYTFSGTIDEGAADHLTSLYIRLRDANGHPLADDRYADAANPSFSFEAPGNGPQTYHLAVSAGGNGAYWDRTGSYSVSLAVEAPHPNEPEPPPAQTPFGSDGRKLTFLAELAVAAYDDNFVFPGGLAPLPVPELSGGFYVDRVDGITGNAIALVGRSSNALFIAFRGTDTKLADYTDFLLGSHYEDFRPMIDALDRYIGDPANGIENVYVTGHSLGAAMAQAFMEEHPGARYEAITFASPGYGIGFDYADDRISSIRIDWDPIGAAAAIGSEGGDLYMIDDVGGAQNDVVLFSNHSMEVYLEVARFIDDRYVFPYPALAGNGAHDDSETIPMRIERTADGFSVAPNDGYESGDFVGTFVQVVTYVPEVLIDVGTLIQDGVETGAQHLDEFGGTAGDFAQDFIEDVIETLWTGWMSGE